MATKYIEKMDRGKIDSHTGFCTISQLSEILGVSNRTIRRYIQEYCIPTELRVINKRAVLVINMDYIKRIK